MGALRMTQQPRTPRERELQQIRTRRTKLARKLAKGETTSLAVSVIEKIRAATATKSCRCVAAELGIHHSTVAKYRRGEVLGEQRYGQQRSLAASVIERIRAFDPSVSALAISRKLGLDRRTVVKYQLREGVTGGVAIEE